jgi:outer membrane lipoprotein-sorting protein
MRFRKGVIPAIVAPLAVVVGAVAVPAIANAASPPPAKTPAQVLTLIAGSHDAHYSGTVQQTSDLGLPQLPSSMSSSAASRGFDAAGLIALVTGSHAAQVYVDGPSKQRVQLLDTLSERDVIHNGTSVWTYDATTRSATHVTAPAHEAKTPMPQATTPATLADQFIASITPTTSVTVSTGTYLGRGVYDLRFAPRTSATLVGDAVVLVDAQTGVPLSVRIDARGQSTPAVSVAFSSIDFSRPGADVFAFTPPHGTTVKDLTVPGDATQRPHPEKKSMQAPAVIGSGWTSIVKVVGQAPTTATPGAGSNSQALLDELSQRVSGGRMLETSLITVYLRDDGTVFAGAVPSATLLAAAK